MTWHTLSASSVLQSTGLEATRVLMQSTLDTHKTLYDRNIKGQYATPELLASAIIVEALKYLPPNDDIAFLEPAIGTGAFFEALLKEANGKKIARATGFEIDSHYGEPSAEYWKGSLLAYFIRDFLQISAPDSESEKYNLIVTNPPYVRHHHINAAEKLMLQDKVMTSFGIRFSGLSGLYCYFMSLASRWLKKDGVSAWLIPGEFLDVNYGTQVKQFLLENTRLLRIHRFKPDDVQFADALVTSVVVFYSTGRTNNEVVFSTGENLNSPTSEHTISALDLAPTVKWSQFFRKKEIHSDSDEVLGDYFFVRRGIATGANEYFILSEEKINQYQIPRTCLRPILPSPRYIKNEIIEADEQGDPIGIPRYYLLNIQGSEREIVQMPTAFREYLENVQKAVKDTYLISRRNPWYRQENRPQCPFLVSYMGRNLEKPFRVFFNKSKATATNVYLMLYPKFNWQKNGTENSQLLQHIYDALSKIDPSTFISSGRVYGGGLFKLEPNELLQLPLKGIFSNDLKKILTQSRAAKTQLSLF